MDEEKVRVELTVHGSIQMVSFRYRVSDIADDLGIVGRIINKPDKTVHIIAEGEKTEILEATPESSTPLMTELTLGDWTAVTIIYVGEGVYFDIAGGTHTLVVESVTATRTIIPVSWEPQTFTMSEGDSQNIDVNGDGKYDFKITCDTITNDPAEGFLQTVKFSFTKKIGETGSGTPGFELIIVLIAVSLILFFRRKRS